jgi:hypothetical protein
MKRHRTLLLAVSIVLCAASAHAAIWGVQANADNNQIININPLNGTVITSFTAPNFSARNTDIGLAGWANELYYTNANAQNGTIYRINPTNGATISSFSVSGGWEINGLGYYSNASGSYIYTSGCSVNDVHRYNAANGSNPTYFWSDISNPLSMAGDNGGRIFTVGSSGGRFGIWQMDPLADLAASWFAASPSNTIVGMAYDGTNLYLSDTLNKLYTYNNNGVLTNTLQLDYTLYALGSTEGTGGEPVPEPGTFALLGAGLGGLILWRRKQSRKA